MSRNARRTVTESGFTAVEAVLLMALLAMATLSLAHTVISGQRCLTYVEDDTRVVDQAQILLSRLTNIPFGTGAEGAASALDLARLVATENTLFGAASGTHDPLEPTQTFNGSTVRLTQLRTASPLNWQYQTAGGKAYYGLGGTWQVVVDRDLNGDGDLLDPLEVATAGSQDLFRIEIRYEGRRVLRTIRSRNPSE